MDDLLKQLAAVALEVSEAESALEEGAAGAARDRLETADEGLTALRARWPQLDARERKLLGAAAQPVRARLDAARAALPRRAAISVAVAEADPEQELDPLAEPPRG